MKIKKDCVQAEYAYATVLTGLYSNVLSNAYCKWCGSHAASTDFWQWDFI